MESRRYGALSRAGLAVVAMAALLAACGSSKHKAALAPTTSPTAAPTTPAPTTPAPTTTGAPANVCPLTGLAPPGGHIPQRPALAIKVENLPVARPQYGLNTADVVYEEPVEGGITRFIVIYQCQDASRVEPIRSGRLIDPEIVNQYGAHPLFAYAGAIQPAVDKIDQSSLIDLSAAQAPASVYPRDSSRYAPHNLMSSTSALYSYAKSLHGPQTTPPKPVFTYGPQVAGATPAASVHIGYLYSDVTYTWQPSKQTWLRSYSDTGVATLGNGGVIAPANIIVMKVVMYASPYVEDATGAHENVLTLTGSGPAQVFRNGTVTTGTWKRPSLSDTTQYLNAAGQPINLTPGQTWIELVPTTVGVSVTP